MSELSWHGGQAPPWTRRDAQLLLTAQAVHAVLHGEYDRLPGLPTEFALPGRYPGNRIIGQSEFVLHTYMAQGDGSYAHNSDVFFATGKLGLAMTAGHMIGKGIGNARRRSAAAAAAVQQWRAIESGIIHVSQFGFHLQTATGLHTWSWEAITQGRVVDRRMFGLMGESTSGPVNYIVESDLAELLFAFWSIARHPQHPQLAQRPWLLPEWLEAYRHHMGAGAFDFTGDVIGPDGRLLGR